MHFRKKWARGNILIDRFSVINDSGFILVTLIVAIFVGFVVLVSGFESLLFRSGSGVTQAVGGWGPVGLIAQYFGRPLPLMLLLFSIYKIRTDPQKATKSYIFLFISLFLTVLLNFPTGVARFYAFTVYLSIVISLFRPDGEKAYTYLSILIIGLAGFSFLDNFRRVDSLESVSLNLEFDINTFFVGHYDAYENFLHSIAYVESQGITMGRQLLGMVLFWVPRSIWANKPISTGAYVAQNYLQLNYQVYNDNLSSSYIEELYIDFHIPAIIIGSLLIGFLFAYLDKTYKLHKEAAENNLFQRHFNTHLEPLYFVLYPVTIGLSLFFLRGSAMTAFAYTCGVVSSYIFVKFLLVKPISYAS